MSSTMYLVRGADGMIRTIMANSEIGAVKSYLREYPADRGDVLSVKERGRGDWSEYDLK